MTVLLVACEVSVRGPFDMALERLEAEVGEKIVVDHCPELPALGKAVCAAHLESGIAFELEVIRTAERIDLWVAGMASGRKAARTLWRVFAPRGLELPDMQCPVLVPIGADRSAVCTGTIKGVPVEAKVTATDERFSFQLVRGVTDGAAMAKMIADQFLGGADPADIDCGFDLRLAVPGTVISCGVVGKGTTAPRIVWVRLDDAAGRATMFDHPPGG